MADKIESPRYVKVAPPRFYSTSYDLEGYIIWPIKELSIFAQKFADLNVVDDCILSDSMSDNGARAEKRNEHATNAPPARGSTHGETMPLVVKSSGLSRNNDILI